jgi:hypothetical protein
MGNDKFISLAIFYTTEEGFGLQFQNPTLKNLANLLRKDCEIAGFTCLIGGEIN